MDSQPQSPAAPPVLALSPDPFVRLTPAQLRRRVRVVCLTILAIVLPIIAVAAYLKPDIKGTGSHTQLGLASCGFYNLTGIPCPMCGCTTATTHIIHGQLLSAVVTQPFGAAFGIACVMAALLALLGLATGKWYGPSPFWLQWHWRTLVLSTLALLIIAWAYKAAFIHTAHGW